MAFQFSTKHFQAPRLSVASQWLAILCCACIIAAIVIAHAGLLFRAAFHADTTTDAPNTGVESLNKGSLHAAIASFEARQQTFKQLGGSLTVPTKSATSSTATSSSATSTPL